MFSTLPTTEIILLLNINVLSANLLNLVRFKHLSFGKEPTFPQTSPRFYVSAVQVFCKNCRKITRNEQFLLFPRCIAPFCETFAISSNSKLSFANSFSLEESKVCLFGKELTLSLLNLTVHHTTPTFNDPAKVAF